MARVSPALPQSYVPIFGEDAPLRLRVYAQRPQLAEALGRYMGVLAAERVLPDRLIELVRIRIAFHNQCRSCMAVRREDLTEDLVCSLEQPETAPDLSEAERAALAYVDLLATDHLAVDDAVFARLHAHFGDAEIVELCMNAALFVGMGRATMTLDAIEDLPDRFRAEGRITPWGDGEVVREGQWIDR